MFSRPQSKWGGDLSSGKNANPRLKVLEDKQQNNS